MNNFERINNLFKNSFIVPIKEVVWIDIIILLYPISLILKSTFIQINSKESIINLIFGIILIVISIFVKRNVVKRNRFSYLLYMKIYNDNENSRNSLIRKCIETSISDFSYKSMFIFHLSIYIELYILSLITNGNINFNIITMLYSIMGSIVLYLTAIASIKDHRRNRIKLLESMEDI